MVNKKFKILWIASIIQLIERVCKTGFNSTLGQKFFFLLEVKNLYVTTFLKANLKLYYLFIRFWLNSDILQDFKMCFLLFWNCDEYRFMSFEFIRPRASYRYGRQDFSPLGIQSLHQRLHQNIHKNIRIYRYCHILCYFPEEKSSQGNSRKKSVFQSFDRSQIRDVKILHFMVEINLGNMPLFMKKNNGFFKFWLVKNS